MELFLRNRDLILCPTASELWQEQHLLATCSFQSELGLRLRLVLGLAHLVDTCPCGALIVTVDDKRGPLVTAATVMPQRRH